MLNERVLNSTGKFKGRVFSVEVQSVALADGQMSEREIVRHNGGACVIAVDEREQVWLVRQFRSPFGKVLLEIPAGKLEPGEDPRVCAERELVEETGLTAEKITLLAHVYPSPGYCSEEISIYLATGLKQGKASPDPGEILHAVRYPFADIINMIDRGEIHDAKTIIALLKLERLLHSGKKAPDYQADEVN